jgi:hypothetical protein
LENGLNRLAGGCGVGGAGREVPAGGDDEAPTRRRIGLARSMPEFFAAKELAAGRDGPGGAHWLAPGPGAVFRFTVLPRDPVPARCGGIEGPRAPGAPSLPWRPLRPSATLRTRWPKACNSSLDNAFIHESSGRVARRFNSSTCCNSRSRSLTS